MTFTTYSAAQAATRARQYTSWAHWMCLGFVRNMITPTVSSQYALPNATSAWLRAQQKVTSGTPPAGAPVYWRWVAPDGRDLGHIAVSLGGGYCRSTDYPGYGQVGTAAISYLTRAKGLTYRGWSRDYAGLTIRGLEVSVGGAIPAPVNYSEATAIVVDDERLRYGLRSSAAVLFNARVWSWLYYHGGADGRAWCVNNYRRWMSEPSDLFGAATQEAMRKMYAILGWSWQNVTYPGPKLLARLGLRAD